MSTKLLNLSGFFDGSPVLRKLRDCLCEQDSKLQPCHMTVSNVLVKNNEVIQLVVSCDGISTTLDIIIPDIEAVKVNEDTEITSVDKSTSCHLITEQICQRKTESSDENIVSCPDTCNCDDCPFLRDDVPVFNVIMKESDPNLDYKESILSIPHSMAPQVDFKRKSFLKITSCKPIRDCQLVLHWNVESYRGVLGYRIFIDGNLKCSVHSPSRTCTLISNVNLKKEHLVSISIIPDPSCPLPKNIVDTLEQFYYQPIKLN